MSKKLFKKAVLIYPKFYEDTFWSFKRCIAKYVPKGKYGLPKTLMPPLGLMGLYRHLKKHYYDEVILIDRNVDPRPLKWFIKDANHVYMGGMIAQEKGFIKDAKVIKKLGKTLIAGGTIVDKNSPIYKLADHMIENEAEMVIDELVIGLKDGTAKKYYEGLPTPPEKFFIPDFSTVNFDNYMNMAIQFSRGCPEDCEFCDITARFGRVTRSTTWEHIETMFRQLKKLKLNKPVFVVDDNFIGDPHKAIETLKKVHNLEREIGVNFSKFTELTLRLADKTPVMIELRKWLRKTNFNMFFIGVETNNIAALIETGKYQNLNKKKISITDNLRFITKETGACITQGIIFGFDSDNKETANSMIKFLNTTHSPIIMVGLLGALPHTKLWDRLENEGRLSRITSGNNSDGRINFIPYTMSAKKAEKQYIKILKGIYSREAFFNRVFRELKTYNPEDLGEQRSKKEGIYTLFRFFTDIKFTPLMLRYLPKAHRIAEKRFGFGTKKYQYMLATYMSDFAKYTHILGQIKYLETMQKKRKYESWQLYSWKNIQESRIEKIEVLESMQKEEESIYQKIKMKLDNGYEFIGTRLDALKYFAAPYINEQIEKIKEKKVNLKSFIDSEISAYKKVHLKRPQILGKINFKKVEKDIRKSLLNKKNYSSKKNNIYKTLLYKLKVKKAYSS